PVLIVEGEKKTGAAEQLAPGYVVVTSPGGAKAADDVDWSPLAGREVIIWPDADDAGRKYAAAVAKNCGAAGALRVSIIEPPSGVPASWDDADAHASGYDEAQTMRLIAAAKSVRSSKPAEPDQTYRRGRPPQRDLLMSYVEGIELWRDDANRAYATF